MGLTKLFLFMFAFSFLPAFVLADVKQTPASDKSPDFTLADQNGNSVTVSVLLKEYRGVVLAFYPKDDTGLWIKQFVEFQQNIKKYEERKIKILGLSRDSAEPHRNFIVKHKLNDMTLLVDKNGGIAKLYDADHWLLPLSRRVYIIIDKDMNIIYRKDMGFFLGFGLLENQTQTLLNEIDLHIK